MSDFKSRKKQKPYEKQSAPKFSMVKILMRGFSSAELELSFRTVHLLEEELSKFSEILLSFSDNLAELDW